MNLQFGLAVIDGLLLLLFVVRLVLLKRDINRYRPSSPLPPKDVFKHSRLTITRVS